MRYFFLLCFGLLAGPASADSAQDALKRFVDKVQTFDAHFEQVQSDDGGKAGKAGNRSSGHFWLARPEAAAKDQPGRFRWAYEKPYEQVSVCDGTKLWAYDPDLNQATVRDARQALSGTPAALLSQRTALSDAFKVEDAGSEGGARLVKLTPKSKDSDFKSIELAIDADGAPVRMRFADQIGGNSEVSFSEIKVNTRIDPAQFRFTPPKGAEIVNDGGIVTKPAE